MSMDENSYIELDRDFVPLDVGRRYRIDDLEILDMFGSRALKWNALLHHDRVVVLAGAESGKTREFRERVRGLREEGRFAQYVTIERLAKDGLDAAMNLQERLGFERWLVSETTGWFFLDSVDEARINHKDVETAFNRFAMALGTAYPKARIILSCRGSAWEGEADLALVQRTLPILPEITTPTPVDPDEALFAKAEPKRMDPFDDGPGVGVEGVVTVVAMSKLGLAQRRVLVDRLKVGSPQAFLDAVWRNGLDGFAQRPGDLRALARYWTKHGRFGTYREMTEFAMTERLREHDPGRQGARLVTDVDVRHAAERLAAAMTLGHTMELVLPTDQSHGNDGVDPYLVLGDWRPEDVSGLLQRGIFVPATFGRLRFYHRSAQEYLTAKWFERLDLPDGELYRIMLADVCGISTVPPSLRAAAAWIAARHHGLREHVLEREPLLLLAEGDPGELTMADRMQLLRTFAERQRDGQAPYRSIDDRSLWMFADEALAQSILDALETNPRREFQLEMVNLVALGVIGGCRDAMRRISNDVDASAYLRTSALHALAKIDDQEGLAQAARSLVDGSGPLDRSLAPAFALSLFPGHLSVDDLLAVIRRTKPARRHQIEGFREELVDIFEACPDASAASRLIDGLGELAFEAPLGEYPRTSKRYGTLVDGLGSVTRAAILAFDGTPLTDGLVRLIRAVAMTDEQRHEGPALRSLVAARTELNRAVFMADVHAASKPGRTEALSLRQVGTGRRAWSLREDDAPWLEGMLASPERSSRHVALDALLRLAREDGSGIDVDRLATLVADDPVLAQALIDARRPPEPDEEASRWERREARGAAISAVRQERERDATFALRDRLQADPGQLRDEALLRQWPGAFPLVQLTDWLRYRKSGQGYDGAALKWRDLAPAFGTDVAEAYRDGMTRLWRLVPAQRPTVTDRGSTSPYDVVLSFAGIGVEAAEDPRWAEGLTTEEAVLAAEHACVDGQNTAPWLGTLLEAHPAIVVPHLEAEFVREWRTATDYAPFLERATHMLNLVPMLQRSLVRLIGGDPPHRIGRIVTAAEIVPRLDLTQKERGMLIGIAKRRMFEARTSDDRDVVRAYLRLLFRLDAAIGAMGLGDDLDALEAEQRWKDASDTLRALFDRHRGSVVDPSAMGPIALAQLVERAYLIAEQVELQGPAIREGASEEEEEEERFDLHDPRDALLSGLADLDGEEAYEAVRRLAGKPAMSVVSHHVLERARQIAERAADRERWSETDVFAFETGRLAPITRGGDLLDLVCSLLDTIDWEFRKADMSARAVVETARNEAAVQEWLGSALEQKSGGRFRCARETQVADDRRPDIIVTGTRSPVEVAIEMKHDEKGWTLDDLGEALTTQLAERYLQPANRRHGVLVVTNHRDAKFWRDNASGERVDFADAIVRLQGEARGILVNDSGPIRVEVRGIDSAPARRQVDPAKDGLTGGSAR